MRRHEISRWWLRELKRQGANFHPSHKSSKAIVSLHKRLLASSLHCTRRILRICYSALRSWKIYGEFSLSSAWFATPGSRTLGEIPSARSVVKLTAPSAAPSHTWPVSAAPSHAGPVSTTPHTTPSRSKSAAPSHTPVSLHARAGKRKLWRRRLFKRIKNCNHSELVNLLVTQKSTYFTSTHSKYHIYSPFNGSEVSQSAACIWSFLSRNERPAKTLRKWTELRWMPNEQNDFLEFLWNTALHYFTEMSTAVLMKVFLRQRFSVTHVNLWMIFPFSYCRAPQFDRRKGYEWPKT